MTVTDLPARASVKAADKPVNPDPIMTMSRLSLRDSKGVDVVDKSTLSCQKGVLESLLSHSKD